MRYSLMKTAASGSFGPFWNGEDYLQLRHKKDDKIADLPPSLYRALRLFILARAIRNIRGHSNKHCSMLINISRFVDVQKTIRSFLSIYVKKLGEAVSANYAMPEKVSSANAHMAELQEVYDKEFSDSGVTWQQVKSEAQQCDERFEAVRGEQQIRRGAGLQEICQRRCRFDCGRHRWPEPSHGVSRSKGSPSVTCTETQRCMTRSCRWGAGSDTVPVSRICAGYFLSNDSIRWYAHIAEGGR